ncbi:PH domain-containing protein [Staphylococcus pseudoxylosus]|uniref:PH domain-containing protein n=1 Tax=Staphylococcus pseudoxylosus TaxID=2282419 RepID=UPI003F57237B
MENYNNMHESGKTVMRLSAIITVVIFLIVLTMFSVVNRVWLEWIDKEQMKWGLIIGVSIAFIYLILNAIFIPIYRYKIFRYSIDDHVVTVRNGLWFVSVMKVPLFRIQNVDTHEGILMRKYKLANLTLSTAGGNINIKFINKTTATNLKQQIKSVNNDKNQSD